jgi:hypothetical protein
MIFFWPSLELLPFIFLTYTFIRSEENVWHMCKYVKENQPELLNKCFAVFISNENQTIPLWSQKQSPDKEGLVIWVKIY